MNGIFTCTDKHLHDVWHQCVRRGADKTADRIAKEMCRRALAAAPYPFPATQRAVAA